MATFVRVLGTRLPVRTLNLCFCDTCYEILAFMGDVYTRGEGMTCFQFEPLLELDVRTRCKKCDDFITMREQALKWLKHGKPELGNGPIANNVDAEAEFQRQYIGTWSADYD